MRFEALVARIGADFVDRFDANSYLYMTRAMDYFDLAADYDGSLARVPGDDAYSGSFDKSEMGLVAVPGLLSLPLGET